MARLKLSYEERTERQEEPELREGFLPFVSTVFREMDLSPRLAELCRLRSAFHAQCPHCMYHRFTDSTETGIDEDLVCSLEKPEEAPGLSDGERVALRYTDLIAANLHLDQDDSIFADLKSHFTERQVVELGFLIAAVHGPQRISAVFRDTETEVPDEYRARAGEIHFSGAGEYVGPPHLRSGRGIPGVARAAARYERKARGPEPGAPRHPSAGARIAPLAREGFTAEYRTFTAELAEDELGPRRIFAYSPAIAMAWERYVTAFSTLGAVSRRLRELVRLRIAYTNQSAYDMAVRDPAVGLSDDVVNALETPSATAGVSSAERAALRYADLLSGNHFAVDESIYDDLRSHFTEPEIVILTNHALAHTMMGRVVAGWQYADELPPPLRDARPGQLHFANSILPLRWLTTSVDARVVAR